MRYPPHPRIHTSTDTHTNSGLGFAVCRRLIDEFLSTRPQSTSLALIITTRTKSKATDTLTRLRHALHKSFSRAETRTPGIRKLLLPRIKLDYELLDLLSLTSVHTAAARLRRRYSKLDAVILNAGMGGWTAVDWPRAVWSILTQRTAALTWPTFKISHAGGLARPQLAPIINGLRADHRHEGDGPGAPEEPVLGEVFTANVFGHYMLTHLLMPLLAGQDVTTPSRPAPHSQEAQSSQAYTIPGRIIWISTLEAYSTAFALSDFQSLRTPLAYEGSKRLTDLLALTSRLPSTAPFTNSYYSVPTHIPSNTTTTTSPSNTNPPTAHNTTAKNIPLITSTRPKHYLCHPGICATGIMPLPLILQWAMLLAFYICRLAGSIWHTCDAYTGATAAVWLALASEETLEAFETPERAEDVEMGGKAGRDGGAGGGGDVRAAYADVARLGKWGSAADVFGNERVERTEVEGWGFSGVPGDGSAKGWRRGRRKGAKDTTGEEREAFEVLGRQCWRGMEELRVMWEDIFGVGTDGQGEEESLVVEGKWDGLVS